MEETKVVQSLIEFKSLAWLISETKKIKEPEKQARFLLNLIFEAKASKELTQAALVHLEQEFKSIQNPEKSLEFVFEMTRAPLRFQPAHTLKWLNRGIQQVSRLKPSQREELRNGLWTETVEFLASLTMGDQIALGSFANQETLAQLILVALEQSELPLALNLYASLRKNHKKEVAKKLADYESQIDGIRLKFREKLKEFSKALDSLESYQKKDDWIEGLDDIERAIDRPIFIDWLSPLVKQIESMAPDPILLENLWILEQLATRLSAWQSRTLIHKALMNQWKLTPPDDENHWMMGLGFLNSGKPEIARKILAKVEDTNKAKAAEILLAIHQPPESTSRFSQIIGSIIELSSHKDSLFQQLFAHISREHFAKCFETFSKVFDQLFKLKAAYFHALLDWVDTAWRLGFASEAIPRLMQLHQEFSDLTTAGQITGGSPLLSLWMNMGYRERARKVLLAMLRLRPQDPELSSLLVENIHEIMEDNEELLPAVFVEQAVGGIRNQRAGGN